MVEEGNDQRVSIGRIPLKQVRVKREEPPKPINPMNALVPYLDLFCRLDDDELARLAHVETDVVSELRAQVIAIDEGLGQYADLLPRLSDGELVRLTGATAKTVRFWRLCQPRSIDTLRDEANGQPGVAAAARLRGGPDLQPSEASPQELEPGPSDSGLREALPETDEDHITDEMPQYTDDSAPLNLS